MAKRPDNNEHNQKNCKKAKLDDDIDWPDLDVDDEILDKCLESATQQDKLRTQNTNAADVSLVSDYNIFRNPVEFTASTQITTVWSSSVKKPNINDAAGEIKELKLKNAEKDGEISILRNKIKENSTRLHQEQQKISNLAKEKLQKTEKDLEIVKSNLDLKNLEILHLKQQLAIKKINDQALINRDSQSSAKSSTMSRNNSEANNVYIKSYKEPLLNQDFPLRSILPKTFLNGLEEKHRIKFANIVSNHTTIPYLQNHNDAEENSLIFNHKCPQIGKEKITLNNVYSEIFQLVNSDENELKSSKSLESVHKVIAVCLIFLKDLDDYLTELCLHMITEDIQKADVNYLLNDSSVNFQKDDFQPGIAASKLLDVISLLLSCNQETEEFICNNKPLKLMANLTEYAKLIPHRNGAIQSDYYFLQLLLDITRNIGKYRLTKSSEEFLISVTSFLTRIANLEEKIIDENTKCGQLFFGIFREIIYARPGNRVIEKITLFLKCSCRHNFFMKELFQKKSNNELLKVTYKGILYFNENVCCFCVLAILLQNYLENVDNNLQICVYYNLLSFIYNSFKSSHWVHHENRNNVCVCISQLYKIAVHAIFKVLEQSTIQFDAISEEWMEFLRSDLIQKVLSLMNFNNFELIEKYVTVFAQYKEIEKKLNIQGLYKMSQLNTNDEAISVPTKSFNDDF